MKQGWRDVSDVEQFLWSNAVVELAAQARLSTAAVNFECDILKLVNSISILWCRALFGLNVLVLNLSKVNFLVPRMYFVKLHGTQFNYVLACVSVICLLRNTGLHVITFCHEHLHIAFFVFFALLFSCLLYFFVFICVYVLYLLPQVGE